MEHKKKKGMYDIDEDSDFPVHESYTQEGKKKEIGSKENLDGLDADEEE